MELTEVERTQMSNLINYRREGTLAGLWHDYANLFPMLEAKGQDSLRSDIEQFGVREPIILFQGRILDGRNRYMAARDLGLDFPVVDFDGTEAEALAYVLSTNLHRRHLTESQRAAVAAKLANMKREDTLAQNRSANLPNGEAEARISNKDAAEMLNVSERSVRTAKAVQETGSEELKQAVERGDITISAAADVAKYIEPDRQAEVPDKDGWKKATKEAREKKACETKKPVEQGAAEPDPYAKERKALSKYTREGLEDELIEARIALKEEREKRKVAEGNSKNLKEQLDQLTADDKAEVIRALNRKVESAGRARRKALEDRDAFSRQVFAQGKEIEKLRKKLESQEIILG